MHHICVASIWTSAVRSASGKCEDDAYLRIAVCGSVSGRSSPHCRGGSAALPPVTGRSGTASTPAIPPSPTCCAACAGARLQAAACRGPDHGSSPAGVHRFRRRSWRPAPGRYCRAELAALDVADITVLPEGLRVVIQCSKTDAEGPCSRSGTPAAAYERWLAAAGSPRGRRFGESIAWAASAGGSAAAPSTGTNCGSRPGFRCRFYALFQDALHATRLRSSSRGSPA